MTIKRGEVYLACLDPTMGAEIKKTRPVVVVSNNISNLHSLTVTVVPLTSQKIEKIYPFEAEVADVKGLAKKSKAKANQIRTIDKRRLTKKLAVLPIKTVFEIDQALRIHLQL
jgi:mRNA interferase MazF